MRRRAFLAMPAILTAAPSTDARIDELTIGFQDYLYRAPYKFGGKEVDRLTMLNVRCRLSTRGGKSAEGGASMSLGNPRAHQLEAAVARLVGGGSGHRSLCYYCAASVLRPSKRARTG